MSPVKASGSVIAAGVVAIIGSCLALLGCGLGLIGLTFIPTAQPASAPMPVYVKSLAIIMTLFFMMLAIFGIFTGVGIIRLRNWARITLLVWSGISAFFTSLSMILMLIIPLPSTPGDPAASVTAVRAFLVVLYAVPLAINIWWLVLFNKRKIRAQFSGVALSGPVAMARATAISAASRDNRRIFGSFLSNRFHTSYLAAAASCSSVWS